MKQSIISGIRLVFKLLPYKLVRSLFGLWLEGVANRDPKTAMGALLAIDADLTNWIDQVAVKYDAGVHVKHRLTGYHDFFIQRIHPGERVLDLGCGKGELAYDIAAKSEALVVGIDINPESLAFARQRFQHPNLTFIEGDALTVEIAKPFDTIVLSNVLEHIEARVAFLTSVKERFHPSRFLIRVPTIDRHWRVPLRKELGLFYFSDVTHYTEYTQPSFVEEVQAAGLDIAHLQINWGEIWATVKRL